MLRLQIICKSVPHRSEKEEEFYQISLDVRGKASLEESLDFYVQGELMEGDNQYFCEDVGKKVGRGHVGHCVPVLCWLGLGLLRPLLQKRTAQHT